MFSRRFLQLFGALLLASCASCQMRIEHVLSRTALQAVYKSQDTIDGLHFTRVTTSENAANAEEREGAICSWVRRTSSCDTSQTALASLLAESNNDFDQFVAQFTSCESAEDEESCTSSGNCLWAAEAKSCYFVEFASGQEDSLCYLAAPGYNQILSHSPVCHTLQSPELCNEDPLCSWLDDVQQCRVDTFQVFCDVSSNEIKKALNLVAIYGMFTYMLDLAMKVDYFDPAFDKWERVLAWKPPKLDCPKGTDPKAWDFAQAQMSRTIPTGYYCSLKYALPDDTEECDQDARCHSNTAASVCQSIVSVAEAEASVFEDMLQFIDTDVDRRIMKGFADCRRTDKEECGGNCVWIVQLKKCLPRENWTFEEIAAIDKSGDDVLCKYFNLEVDSGCRKNVPSGPCSEMQQCQWRSLDQICLPTTKYLMKGALNADPDANVSVDMLHRHCQEFVVKDECLAASVRATT